MGFLALALMATAWLLSPLRIAKPEINDLVALGTVEVAFISAGASFLLLPHRWWVRIFAASPFAILAVLYPCTLALSMVGGGPMIQHEVVASVPLNGSRVVAYRRNGGATTDYSIRITHEMPILPGIIAARNLHHQNHGYRASLAVTGPDLISVSINDGEPKEHPLRKHVVF
jgi:hypothetical protein